MAPLRNRLLAKDLEKQLKFWPVLCLLGPRQSGKSTLLRDLVFVDHPKQYVSFDRYAVRLAAQQNIELFLGQFESHTSQPIVPIIIDEAHKVPQLFDEIKAEVDENRRPGRFILTGSVRFSSKIGIRESLTGRSATLKFDSMTYAETTNEPLTMKTLNRYLNLGGMPGVCFLQDHDQRERYWAEWLETSCQKDLLEYSKGKLDATLAYQILKCASTLERPDISAMAKQLRVDSRRIKSHVEALEALFLLRPWQPDGESVGKTMYIPFDCGLAEHFGGNLRRKWQVWFSHEIINNQRFLGKKDPDLNFNLTARGAFADFNLSKYTVIFNEGAYPDSQLTKSIKAIEARIPKKKILVASMTDQPARKITARSMSVPCKDLIKIDLI